jgi:hypothetical protein
MNDVLTAANNIRELWLQKPVANDPEWHAAVLALVQALDAKFEAENTNDAITVKQLIEALAKFPPDAVLYAYEGEETGIAILDEQDQEIGFIPAPYEPKLRWQTPREPASGS